jgi:predicted esterase
VTRSQLVFRVDEPAGAVDGTLIVLHRHASGGAEALPLARSLAPRFRVVVPDAARGVFEANELVAYTWFGGTNEEPEPASFGDSLYQLEQFVYDAEERWGHRPVLLGFGQGGALALGAALVVPDHLSGVAAVGADYPSVPALEPRPFDDLPLLLAASPAPVAAWLAGLSPLPAPGLLG